MKKGSIDQGLVYHAGFPNAGEDQHGVSLSLDKLVVKHRASTYFWRLESEVPELHWPAGTIASVDRAVSPASSRIVVATIEGVFVLCRVRRDGLYLLDGTKAAADSTVWGVVTYAIQEVR